MTSLLSGPKALLATAIAISTLVGIPLAELIRMSGIEGISGFAVLISILIPVNVLTRRWLNHLITTNATYTLTITSPGEPHVDMRGYEGTKVSVTEGPTSNGWEMTVKVNGGMADK